VGAPYLERSEGDRLFEEPSKGGNASTIHPFLRQEKAAYDKYFPNGGGSIFTFDIKGGAEEAKSVYRQASDLLAACKRRRREVPGDSTRRGTTHSQMTESELRDARIRPNTIVYPLERNTSTI
jgi:O-acetylhomoserine (thiol)-lyase